MIVQSAISRFGSGRSLLSWPSVSRRPFGLPQNSSSYPFPPPPMVLPDNAFCGGSLGQRLPSGCLCSELCLLCVIANFLLRTSVFGAWETGAPGYSRFFLRPFLFFSSRRRHTRFDCDWSSDVCSSD